MTKLKTFRPLLTDEDAERAIEDEDLSEYDLSGFRPFDEVYDVVDGKVHPRLVVPTDLAERLRLKAEKNGTDAKALLQRFLEEGLAS